MLKGVKEIDIHLKNVSNCCDVLLLETEVSDSDDKDFLTTDENDTGKNVPPIFCQVPNNTCISSAAVKTLLNQPHNFSAIQFYNPPISKVNKFEIKWYTDDGSLVRILDHCFTIRIYYFQKRIDTTDFSFPIP